MHDHLGDAARPRREHGRADGQRLDDGVREVLPARGEDRRVGGAEELEHAARAAAGRGSARGRRSRARRRAWRAARGRAPRRRPAARRRPRWRPRGSRRPSDFCAVSRPAKASVAPLTPSAPLELASRAGQVARRRRRVRQHRDALRRHAPGDGELAQPRARAEDVRRAAQLGVARAARRRSRLEAAAARLELLHLAADGAAPPRALERRVGGQLDDVRPPRGERSRRRCARTSRSCRRRPRRAARDRISAAVRTWMHALRQAPRRPAHGIGRAPPAALPPSSRPRPHARGRGASRRRRARGSPARRRPAARSRRRRAPSPRDRLARHRRRGAVRLAPYAREEQRPVQRRRRRSRRASRRPRPSRPTARRARARAGPARASRRRA